MSRCQPVSLRRFLLACAWLLAMLLAVMPSAHGQEEEPHFGSSTLDMLRVYDGSQGIDTIWNWPAHALSLSVPYLTSSIRLQAQSINYGRDIELSGTASNWLSIADSNQMYSQYSGYLSLAVGSNSVQVVSQYPTLPAETYTITVTRQPASNNAALSAIGLSVGGNLAPAFAPASYNYTLDVASSVDTLLLSPAASDYGTVTVNGGSSATPVALATGNNSIDIDVTAQDGVTSQRYTLLVNRASPVGDLSLAGLRLVGVDGSSNSFVPDYSSNTLSASVLYATSRFTVAPTAADSQARITVNGQSVASGGSSPPVDLSGASATVTIVVSAADGSASRSYTLTVNRAAAGSDDRLADLQASGQTLDSMLPAFSADQLSYRFSYISIYGQSPDTPELNVRASTSHRYASLTINGRAASSGVATSVPLVIGANAVTVRVGAENGLSARDYVLNVTRSGDRQDASLQQLTLSAGSMQPGFSGSVLRYDARVPLATTRIAVTPSGSDSVVAFGAIKVNGEACASGSASAGIDLVPGNNTINVQVLAGDGSSSRTYTINVLRGEVSDNADLAALQLSAGSLVPLFATTTTAYRVQLPYAASTLSLTPSGVYSFAGIRVNGNEVSSGTAIAVPLQVGSNTIYVDLLAEDGITQRRYILTVLRAADSELDSLSLSQGVLQPAFSANVGSYRALLGHAVSSLDLLTGSSGVIRVNGQQVGSGSATSLPLAVGDNVVEVLVSSADGSRSKQYHLTLSRAADPLLGGVVPSFAHAPGMAASFYGWHAAVADVNGDGRLDVLASTMDPAPQPSLYSFLGTAGQGLPAAGNYRAAARGGYLVGGDVNGDGKDDVVVISNQSNGSAEVLLSNGDGSFRAASTLSLGIYPRYSVIADFTGDGQADLVVQESGRVILLSGNGDGSFAAPVMLATFNELVNTLAGSDLNQDGKRDLLLALSDRILVLLGRGDGSFLAPVAYVTGRRDANALAVADFNRDGWLDVAVGHYGGEIALFAGTGDGALAAPTLYGGPAQSRTLLAADYNGDGQIDLLAVPQENDQRRFVVMLGAGGSLASPIAFPVSYGSEDRVPTTITDAVSGDFNGDGKPDVLVVAVSSGSENSSLYLAENRTPTLRALALSAGSLTPPLAAALRDYRVAVAHGTASLSLTPSLSSAGRSVTVNGLAVNSGSASSAIALSPGDNLLTVVVTDVGGTVDTYRLSVFRDWPLPPPSAVVATAGDAQVTLNFSPPPDDGGSPVLDYVVHAVPAEGVDAQAGSNALRRVISGLRNGVSYTFTVIARNALGSSQPSAASAAVTPTLAVPPLSPAAPNDGTPAPGEVQVSGSGSFVADGSLPVVISADAVGAHLSISATASVSMSINGLSLRVQTVSGSVLRIAQLTVDGKALLLPEVTSGQVQFTASSAGQILFSLAGGAVVASTADTVLTAGPGQLVVSRGAVHLPANAFAAGASGDLYAGEVALLNAAGKVSRIRLGSADGSGNLAGDPVNTAAAPANLSLKARIPRLSGSVARLPAGLEQTLATALGGSGQQNSSGSFNFSAESVLSLLPVGEIVIDASLADGVSLTNDGLARVVSNGVVVTLAPAPRDLHQFAGDLAQAFSGATLSVRDKGVLVAHLAGVDYVFRPSAWVEPASATAAFQQGSDGLLRYRDGQGGQQILYPAFYDGSALAVILSQLASGVSSAVQVDGSMIVRYGANTVILIPDWALTSALPDSPPWWLGGDGKVYVNDGSVVQGMSVR